MDARSKAWQAARKAFVIESEALFAMPALLSLSEQSFMKAVDVLSKAERIASSGCGHSGIACRHFAHLMCCIERPTRFISPAEAVHGGTGFLKNHDVMLLASRGGRTKELLPIMEICNRKGVTIISVTENMNSPLAEGADIVLPFIITRETDRYNSQGTTSFTVLSVLFHALQAALIEVTDFQNEQFALIHPGGAVGERLNSQES